MASRRMSSRRTITNSLSDIQRRLKYLEARSSPSRLANEVVKRTNIQPRAVSSDQIALASITNSLIEAETITSSEIALNAITNSELAPNSVNTENFVVSSVTNAAIAPRAVSQSNMQNNSVGQDQIRSSSVGGDEIQNGAINSDKIQNGAVLESKIAINAVSNTKIASGAVTAIKIGSQAVTFDKILGGTSIITEILESTGIVVGTNAATRGSRTFIRVDHGLGSNQVARGNHTHSVSTTLTPTSAPSTGVIHTHNYRIATSPTSTPSTLRVKKEVSDYVFDDPRRLLGLKLKRFKYKNPQRGLHEGANREWMYGYIAEEVQKAGVEEILGYDSDGLVDSVNYGLLSTLLLELVRAHQEEIDSLRQDLKRLKE